MSTGILLEGNLASVSLPNLLQLITLEQKTAVLTLNRVEIGQDAEIYFRRGEAVAAFVNQVAGNLAMCRILGWWTAGTFKLIQIGPDEIPEPNITTRLDYLLLEGMRQMDATAELRNLLPQITSSVSFTQAALQAFSWDISEPAEWIPHDLRVLPKSFSVAQLHQVSRRDELSQAHLMRMLLATQALRLNTGLNTETYDGLVETGVDGSRYEAFAHVLMEFIGYEHAYRHLDNAINDMGAVDLEGFTFTQLLELCDRISGNLRSLLDRKQQLEISRRLRARATSLL